jgi:hypothetical protein
MENLASLAEALEKLGFHASLQTSISTFINLQLHRFNVHYKAVKERDVIQFNLFFQKKENAYSCLYYDAILRKEIVLPDTIVDNVPIKDLGVQMSAIDWKGLFDKEQNIESIIRNLNVLQSSKEGKEFAESLKAKYWFDTPLETIMNISFIKSRFEITQRFYLMENNNGISIEEAYRFLNNKWMERQLKKKPVVIAAPVQAKSNSKSKKSKLNKS